MKQQEQVVAIASAGQTIRGFYLPQEANPTCPVVIFAHGLGSTRQGEKAVALAAECTQRQWAFAAFDFHGHGESDGTMLDLRGSRLLSDMGAITQYVQKLGHQIIFLVGSSMGGWAVSWFATLYPQNVNACALIAPAFRFLEYPRLNATARQQWQRTGRMRLTNQWIDIELDYALPTEAEQFPFAQLGERFSTPCSIHHGMQDETVPYQNSIDFIERCKATKVQLHLIKNGDHRLSEQKELLARNICNFFAAQLNE